MLKSFTQIRPVSGALVLAAAMFASSAAHAAFTCPDPGQVASTPLAADVDSALPKGEELADAAKLQAGAALLKEHGIQSADAINQLIARYCAGVAADAGLDDAQKTERVQKFAQAASSTVLDQSSEDALLFDVPLPPATAAIVLQKAHQEGVSAESWIAKLVEGSIK